MDGKKPLNKAKDLFNSLKTDLWSVIFAEETIDNKLLKKIKNQNMKQTSHCLNW